MKILLIFLIIGNLYTVELIKTDSRLLLFEDNRLTEIFSKINLLESIRKQNSKFTSISYLNRNFYLLDVNNKKIIQTDESLNIVSEYKIDKTMKTDHKISAIKNNEVLVFSKEELCFYKIYDGKMKRFLQYNDNITNWYCKNGLLVIMNDNIITLYDFNGIYKKTINTNIENIRKIHIANDDIFILNKDRKLFKTNKELSKSLDIDVDDFYIDGKLVILKNGDLIEREI
ncbi:MAG: hypothetical protein JXR48_03310 [Candidatus Delongbacteria bacterium]|nr:hypothetical protein [Candidatus Delongbacteria bacterium]MBN2833976.1 hypothetical protein [Candidatus Delongbacteria bacterium]